MIRIAFELFINLIETLISVDFITSYFGMKYQDERRRKTSFFIVWIIAFIQMDITNYVTEFETIGAYIPMIIYFIYAWVCLNGRLMTKALISALTHLIVVITALSTNLLICNIIGYDPHDMITVFNTTRIVGVSIAKLMQFYATRIILKNKHHNPLDKNKWLLIIFIPLISVISLSALMKAALISNVVSGYIFIGMICILVADIITYYFFAVMDKNYENIMKTKLLEQQNVNLEQHIADSEAFVEQMKSVRHDMKNQWITVNGFLTKGDFENAKNHVNLILHEYMPNILNNIKTDNSVFDAIVNSKIAVCNQKNIFMEIDIKNGVRISLNDADTVSLFGNLIDNAIEAAEQTKNGRIKIVIDELGDYLVIKVTNSENEQVLIDENDPQTTKSDKEMHGIGIKSIRTIVRKYNGMIKFYENDNEFNCHIMLTNNCEK